MSNQVMYSLQKAEAAEALQWLEAPIPTIGEDDVLIKVRRTGICGTDIHIWDWDAWAQSIVPVPIITGHEFSGEVFEVGKNVSTLKVGQRVSGEGHLIQHSSRQARSGRFHLDPGTRGLGVETDGAFAQYVQLPAFNVIELPDSISDDLGAILDPLGNAVHTALAFDILGEDVLITGAGPIGIMAAAVCRFAGARNVVLTDINDARLTLARSVVADVHTVNVSTRNLEAEMQALGIKQGFDIGLEMSGSGAALSQMIEALDVGGRLALLGIPSTSADLDLSRVVLKSITLKGIYGREMFETWYKMLAMLDAGLNIEPIITHRFPARDFEGAFAAMKSGQTGKVVLDWTEV